MTLFETVFICPSADPRGCNCFAFVEGLKWEGRVEISPVDFELSKR